MEFVEIQNPDTLSYSAQKALIFYSIDKKQHDGHGMRTGTAPEHFVTVHRIQGGLVCEGKPVTRKIAENLCRLLLPNLAEADAYLPERVLAYSRSCGMLTWWLPAGQRHLYFHTSTGIPNGIAPLPALVFCLRDGSLSVHALKEDRRPTPGTILYWNPFFNGVCMGNVKLPAAFSPGDIDKLEHLYFGAEFTLDHAPSLKGADGASLWKSLVGGKEKEFPLRHLMKAGTLGELLGGKIHG